MKILRILNHRDLLQALSHVHLLAHVHFVEKKGDELGHSFQDPSLCTVNRFVDFLTTNDPDGECWINGEGGSEPVIGALIAPDGVRLLLDREQAKSPGAPK